MVIRSTCGDIHKLDPTENASTGAVSTKPIMSSNTPEIPIKKSSTGNKKPKHCGGSSSNAYQSQNQNRSEPPFPLYSSTHDDNDDGDDTTKSTDTAVPRARPTLEEGWNSVVQLLRGRKRIAVLTGAGMSVSCGIPDFRTKGSGLYSTLDTAVRTLFRWGHICLF